MATTNLNASQNRTVVNNIFGNTSFADLRNDTTGGYLFDGPHNDYYGVVVRSYNFLGTNYYTFGHPFMDFDLSSISDTITGVSLLLEGKSSLNFTGQSNNDGDAIILLGEFADTLGNSDMNKYVGHTSGWGASDVTELSSPFGPAGGGSWNTSGTNTITLNSDAVTAAENARQAGNRFKLCLVNYTQFYLNDSGVLGTNSTGVNYKFNFHNDLGEANEPILQVTHGVVVSTFTPTMKIQSGFTLKGGKLTIK
tara:strand:- start:290 stop:1045 length:756 start_codon:yes stop_codon:yes gene_type:complete